MVKRKAEILNKRILKPTVGNVTLSGATENDTVKKDLHSFDIIYKLIPIKALGLHVK